MAKELLLSEEDWFDVYAPVLRWWANTRTGRDVLGIDYDRPRVWRVTPNSVHVRLSGGELLAEFRTEKLYTRRVRERWSEWLAALRYFDRRTAETEAYWRLPLRLAATSRTFVPDADPETDTVDGAVEHAVAENVWATFTGGAGTGADDSSESMWVAFLAGSTEDRWTGLSRAILLFNTASLSGQTVRRAYVELYATSKLDQNLAEPNLNVYASNPGSNTELAAGDFDSLGSTEFSTSLAYGSIGVSASGTANVFVLNASGLAAVNTSGVTKLGLRNANYDVANSAPPWVGGGLSRISIRQTDPYAGAKPRLVAVYGVGGAIALGAPF